MSKTNYLDLFSKGCKYLNLRDACISGSLNLSNQSDDNKDMVKKPCRPLVFCGPPGVDISSIIKGTFFFLNDLFLYLAIDTVFHPSGIIQNGMEISSKSHV